MHIFKKYDRISEIMADKIVEGFSGSNISNEIDIPVDATDPIEVEESEDAELAEDETLKSQIYNMFRRNKLALLSAIIIIIFVCLAIFAPLIAPSDPVAQDLYSKTINWAPNHILGTDHLGRDVFSRMLYGSRVSLMIGLIPTLISMVIGTLLGVVSGYIGGIIDSVIMRIADVLMAFPSLLLAMLISYTLGKGMLTIFVAISFVGWAGTARLIRSEVLSLREKEYVEAANSIGVKKSIIMIRHILPNCIPTLVVLFTMNVPGNILTEASLSFLGIGAQPPSTSWGLLVFEMKKYLATAPIPTLAPGIAILILVVAFNFLGDAIRDEFDPSLKD